ncbi:SMC family ATPase, partial [Candidatus Woesearchaeota archaeon]|nr:SMC family ATPase [Candidatus Woesearchaeota archaeon]
MIIRKVKLENIRSYVDQEIELPEGSVLLSGDIGSGKSTILLAIDFALFGIRKPDLTGDALLRNGASTGSVELHFTIDGKEVVIKRTLKRSKLGVGQESGFIMVDLIKREGTAVELKQHILNLLNYPKELLTKSKSMIYKYTVYTPQEEMKHILVEEQDMRLDTLRRVFGIDKYKRVKENTKILITAIKGKKENLKGIIEDLEEKKEDLAKKREGLEEKKQKLEIIKPKIELLKGYSDKKKKELEEVEKNIKEANETKAQLKIKKVEQKTLENQKSEIIAEIDGLNKQISRLEKETRTEDEQDFESLIRAKQGLISSLEKDLQEALKNISSLKTKREESEDLKNRISGLENCPTCKQEVRHEHKSAIEEEENNKLSAINKRLSVIETSYADKQKQLSRTKEELESLKEASMQRELNKLKVQNLEEKKKRKDRLEAQQKQLTNEIGILISNINTLEEKFKSFESLEVSYEQKKQELEELREQKSVLDQEASVIRNDIKNFTETIEGLRGEIIHKEESKKELAKMAQLQEWLEKQFISLMEVMEKNIMLKVHNDFDSLFQRWFSMLV